MGQGVLPYVSELSCFFNNFARIVILLKYLIVQVMQALLTLLKYLCSTRFFLWVSCCSVTSFLCSVLLTILRLFVLFLLTMVLSVSFDHGVVCFFWPWCCLFCWGTTSHYSLGIFKLVLYILCSPFRKIYEVLYMSTRNVSSRSELKNLLFNDEFMPLITFCRRKKYQFMTCFIWTFI